MGYFSSNTEKSRTFREKLLKFCLLLSTWTFDKIPDLTDCLRQRYHPSKNSAVDISYRGGAYHVDKKIINLPTVNIFSWIKNDVTYFKRLSCSSRAFLFLFSKKLSLNQNEKTLALAVNERIIILESTTFFSAWSLSPSFCPCFKWSN